MKNPRSLHPISLLLAVLCLLTLTLYFHPVVSTSAQERDDVAAVTEAWERARGSGFYRYAADIVQRTIPRPTVTNVGRSGHREELHVEGEANMLDRSMLMHLWSQGGNVSDLESGAEVRVEDSRAYARQGDGAWEEIDDFTGLFAPQGDLMAFLSAAKDIKNQGTETRVLPSPQVPLSGREKGDTSSRQGGEEEIVFTRYTFNVDGLNYARYLRDQIAQELAQKGELPAGVNLDLPRQYVDMEGTGELWVGSDGLPLRQIVHLTLPQRPDVQIEAQITVDFYDFGEGTQSSGTIDSSLRPRAFGNLRIFDPQVLRQAALFASILAFVGLLAVHSRSRKVYVMVALAVIGSMIVTPLLQSAQAADFARRQAQRAREQEQRQEENEKLQALRNFRATQALSQRPHHPNRSPLNPAPLLEQGSARGYGLGTTADSESFNCRDEDRTDTDEDGLTDCQEGFLGTSPDNVDSDQDTISDAAEVQGFDYGGRTWYTDPMESDTNDDSIGDRREWNVPGSEHATWDTDGDGTPDLFDQDNDDDGVPDPIDLSPFTVKNDVTFDDGSPLLMRLNNLEVGLPTYVEFQLRPTEPDHLWYAMNVLDWPEGDNRANIQDEDGNTFYKQDNDLPLSPNDNGDLKLIPMLEIRISGNRTNLPPQGELDHYGVFVLDLNKSGSDKVVYVPLNVITDDDEDGRAKSRVAFYGKMLYRPEDSWGNAHQVRLVWLLQALVDICADDGYEDGMCKNYETKNQVEVIHTYYDEWTLTGLNVREDHGVDVAFVYDDPAVDSDLHDDSPLIGLAYGLEHSFLAGRDADEIPGRDVTVDEIYRRFNHATNPAVADEERWNITDTLSVEVHAYEHVDVAMATIPMTDTKELLEHVFTDHWSASAPITPTVMLAREEYYRAVNLDIQDQSDTISWDGAELSVDLPPSGENAVYVQVTGGVNWTPYQYRAGWEPCPIDVYWSELVSRDPFAAEEDPDEATGLLFLLQLYYVALYRGVHAVVQVGDIVIETEAVRLDSTLKLVGALAGQVVKHVLMAMIKPILKEIPGFLGKLGEMVGNLVYFGTLKQVFWDLPSKLAGALAKIPKWLVVGAVAIVVIIIVVIFAAAMITLALLGWVGQYKWAQVTFMLVYHVTVAVIMIITAVTTTVTAITAWGYVIGFIINVGVIWIVFLVQAAKANLQPGDPELGMLLSYAVAATILATVLFLIFVFVAAINIVAGAIVATLLALIIGIAEAIGLIWDFSPTDFLTRQIAGVFYFYDPVVDLDVDVDAPDMSLRNPDLGLTSHNRIKFATTVTTTISTKKPPWHRRGNVDAEPIYNDFWHFWSSAVDYRLDRNVGEPDNPVPQRGYPWVKSGDTWWIYLGQTVEGRLITYRARDTLDIGLYNYISPKAGVNSHIPVVFVMSYVLPGIECVPTWSGPSCEKVHLEGEGAMDMGLAYDILPGSLDGFYSLEATLNLADLPDGGYRLAWDESFRALMDADGDGLLSSAHNGPDPDDGTWDTDGDGLSDAYELELREAGINVSVNSRDVDGDGLSDADEVRLGTRPNVADSDYDGLTDGEETFHQQADGTWAGGWHFVYGFDGLGQPLRTLVTSDPTARDSDGDGMNDLTERTLGTVPDPVGEYAFQPRVANSSPVALYTALHDEDGVIAPGTTVPYTAAVQNNLVVPLYSIGDLNVDFPPQIQTADIDAPFTLFAGEALTVTTNVVVPASAASAHVEITNMMDASLASNPSCANVRFEAFHCDTATDRDPGPEDHFPAGSEVFLHFDGPTIWDATGVDDNGHYPINTVKSFCNQTPVNMWECDWYLFGCTPTFLEEWTIGPQQAGTVAVRSINDSPADLVGVLTYTVYYAGGTIDQDEVIAVTIDADPPSASTVTSLSDGGYVRGTTEPLIIGGEAADPTSAIATVEVSVDGAGWEMATGAESWAYAWDIPAGAGSHTLRTRATDVVGHTFTETTGTTVSVDIYPPDVSTPIQNGATVAATQDAGGRWTVPLYGTVQDRLDFGGPPGSGVRSVEVFLEGIDDVAGRGWQTATLTAQGGSSWDWALDYVFPPINNDEEMMTEPTGEYTFIVRAVDGVGNVAHGALAILLRIDSTAPVATVTDTGPASDLITQSLTISGVVTDPGVVAKGVAGLEIAYTPVEIASTFSPADMALLLHLDEPAGATTFRDAIGYNHASCTGDSCPTAGESGVSGAALRFDGVDDYAEMPDLPDYDEVTVAMWIRVAELPSSLRSLIHHDGWNQGDIHLHLTTDGKLEFALNGNSPPWLYSDVVFDGDTFDQWVHLAYVYDAGQKEVSFYVDGVLDTAGSFTTAIAGDLGPGQIGNWDGGARPFDGDMDEIFVFDRALSAPEIEQLYNIGGTGRGLFEWQVATLAEAGDGITRTTWTHVVPPDLDEGLYQIELRPTDVLSNRNDTSATWPQWEGEIDIHAPHVDVTFLLAGMISDATARTEYTCEAEDLSLVEDGFQCPCPVLPGDRTAYDDAWYRRWVSDTARLYRIETSCLMPGHRSAASALVSACDRHGHCAQDTAGLAVQAVTAITSPLDSVVFTPTYGTLLTTTSPISVAGGVYAKRANGLKALTVTVDSDAIHTKTWSPGESHGEMWYTTWLTLSEGPHTISSVAADHYYVQTDTHPITVVVDTQAPEIGRPTGVLTTAHRLPGGGVILTGPYTETGGVASIQVRDLTPGPGVGEWGDAAVFDSNTYRYAWFLSEQVDGEPFILTVRIADLVGRTMQQTGTVTVDLVAPAPVTLTLAYTDSLGVRSVITPGDTIRDVLSPTLLIEWTASSSSDLSGYRAGWIGEPVGDVGSLFAYGPADLRHAQQAGEAQANFAHVVAQDANGNRRWHTLGPIYTDVPTTSDYITNLDYHGWMESGCSQIGADRELARYVQTGQALTGTQRFYVTWNTQTASTDTLRLAWTGANWGSDGDLFIYFDTAPGGSTVAHDPYTGATHIGLPAQGGRQLAADYLVWVEDEATVTLMEWSGSAWVDAITDTLSGPPYYQLDTSREAPLTDLALPFGWLGITETTSLNMVALASEEDALRLWAAMPEKNPLSSKWAINTLAEVIEVGNLAYTLTQQYEWEALGPGACPNAGQFTDADLLVDIIADPPGVEVGYLEHDLLFLTPGQFLDGDLDGEPDVILPMDTDPALIGHGMIVTYTIHYANEGTEVAPGVRVTATAQGAVKFASDPLVVVLGNVAAGVTATRKFTGVVNTSVYTTSGDVMAVVADDIHGPLDWLWIQHDVDSVAPERVEIESPLAYVQPYTNTVRGTVYDRSGVTTITLRSRLLPFGGYVSVDCADATPKDGQWSCEWNVGDADNGERYTLQASAVDRFGNGPTVGEMVTVTVDTQPPTITLDLDADDRLAGAVLGADEEILLTGQVEDDQKAGGAEICIEQAGEPYCEQISLRSGATTIGDWSYALQAVGELDYLDQSLSLYGIDGANNRSTVPLSRTYKVDNVPPVVTVTTWIRYTPTVTSTLVLDGVVNDGSGSSDVYILVEAPDETLTSTLAARVGDNWSYILHPSTEGDYSLRIEARDGNGNVKGLGPYRVIVGSKTVYLPLVLRNN